MSYSIIGNNNVDVNATEGVGLDISIKNSSSLAGYMNIIGDTKVSSKNSSNQRLKISYGTTIFSEFFPGTAINTTIWIAPTTTMTVTQTPGSVQLNAGLSVATAVRAHLATKQCFPIFGAYGISVRMAVAVVQYPLMGNQLEWGAFTWGSYPATSQAQITDGVYWRISETGNIYAGVNNNGIEHLSDPFTYEELFTYPSDYHDFEFTINDSEVYFFINGDLKHTYSFNSNEDTTTIANKNIPISFRNYNNAATSAAQVLKISRVSANLLNKTAAKDWRHVLAGLGANGSQGQTGGTLGTTAVYTNSANPTAAVATNTTAALGTGLGGQFWETCTVAAGTDVIISSYQNPAGTVTLPGRCLYIYGVWINSYTQVALTGGGFNNQFFLAFGHTSVSLATAESATAKGPRRIALGTNAVAAGTAVSTALAPIYRQFTSPIVIQPGEFVAVCRKGIGTAPSAGVIAYVIGFDSVWE